MSEQQIDFPRDIESFLQRLSNKNSKWVFYNVQDFGAQYRRVILGLSRQVEQMHLKTVGVVADNYKKKSTDDTEGAKEALNGLIASLEAVDIPIILSDLHDFQYTTDESRQAFYWDLIKRGEKSENENFALACSVQIGEFLRRHGMPDAAIKKSKPMMIEEFADKLSLRSSAGYELAQAFRIKGDTEAGATYLHNSGKDAIRAGEPVKGLRIQEESYWWLAQDNPAGDARFDIAGAKTHFEQMLESEAH
ncbi:hypothetical protein KKF03_04250, partial [Patescibacteria group bacterium]|nr:hypothetical protein [Patescibacteria group bacterium]